MKKTILSIVLAFSSYASAQVGINTDKPKATLDITANTDGTIAVPSGLLIPRITREQAAKVTTDTSLITTPVESTLIYINDISVETPIKSVATDIDAKGYYFYSSVNQKWTKIANNPDGTSNFNFNFENGLTPTSTGNITNVQLGGTIKKETILNINRDTDSDASLKITGNINNLFSVEDALSVDGENNFVGIGTKNPQNKLHISSGSLQLEGPLRVGSDNNGLGNPGTLGQVLVSKGTDAPPEWTPIEFPGGGSLNPIAVNAINGIDSNDNDNDGIYTVKLGVNPIVEKTILNIDPTNNSDASLNITGNVKGAFSVGGSNFSVDNTGIGRVGIGTSSPSRKLHIHNTSAGAIRIVDGTEGDNKVLTSNNLGVGTWKSLPTATPLEAENGLFLDPSSNTLTLGGILTKTEDTVITATTNSKLKINGNVSNAFSVESTTATNLSVDNSNNRVGIGTINPRVNLDIKGIVANNSQTATISSNSVNITTLNESYVQITGNANANFSVSLPKGEDGQRLVIVNNTSSAYDAIIDSYHIPNGDAVEFIYSGNKWRSLRGGERSNVTIYGTTLPIYPHASEVYGENIVNKTSGNVISPGGDGMWYIDSQTNFKADGGFIMQAINNSDLSDVGYQLLFSPSRKIVKYVYKGTPFDEGSVFPIVTAGNNKSDRYNDAFVTNVIDFKRENGKTTLILSIVRADYFSNILSGIKLDDYDEGTSDWQGYFFVNILLATKHTDL